MATAEQAIPQASAGYVRPRPEDQIGQKQADDLALDIARRHSRIKGTKRQRDLTAEKYMMHVDGEGDSQWADIKWGSRVEVPGRFSDNALRLQENLERPLLRNYLAYLTSQPIRFAAKAKPDRRSRDRARIDTAFANTLSQRQKLNRVTRGAVSIGACYGHGIVHSTYRDDVARDDFDPLYGAMGQRRGFVDFWVGDPWETCYDEDSTRTSVRRLSYGRILPLSAVKQAFQREELTGDTHLPSASRFQRIGRLWQSFGGPHGTAVMQGSAYTGMPMIALVCDEILPGVDPDYPAGRLAIVALSGSTETGQGGGERGPGKPVLLHMDRLPGGVFSTTRFYSDDRFDDVLGKPWIGDIDDHQVRLNQFITLTAEISQKLGHPPFAVVGDYEMENDAEIWDDDAIIRIWGAQTNAGGQFLYPPYQAIQSLMALAEQERSAMFRIGSWQAASRGESRSGEAAAKVVALAQFDDTLLATSAYDFRDSCCELMQTAHAIAREHMDAPMVVGVAGEEFGYLAEEYITGDMLSPEPPEFEVVSGFGVTPEHRMQQLSTLVTMIGADGQPVMSTEQMWKHWPDPSMRPEENGSAEMRYRRARVINQAIRDLAGRLDQEAEQLPEQWRGQMVQQGLQMALQDHFTDYPLLRDDDPTVHIEVLSEITQDETESRIARQVASQRSDLYHEWLAAIQAQMQAEQAGPEGSAPNEKKPGARRLAAGAGGTQTAQATQDATNEVADYTQQAVDMKAGTA